MYKYKVINKKRFYIFITSLLLSILFSGFFMISATAFNRGGFNLEEEKIYIEKILVNKGDTLWNIALEFKEDSIDVRDMVEIIKDLNELRSSEIYVGTVLKVPVKK